MESRKHDSSNGAVQCPVHPSPDNRLPHRCVTRVSRIERGLTTSIGESPTTHTDRTDKALSESH